MEIIADLQIHSKYARATSKDISIENLEKYGRMKGLNLLGTGDFQHPLRRKEIDEKLIEDDKGILRTANGFAFLWQTEVSLMFSQGGKRRAVHLLVFAPNIKIADEITKYLGSKGRLDYDGRPIFGITCEKFVKEIKNIDDKIEIIPAHAWTPWFGIFGSDSGFDSLKECFGEQVKHIYAIETGMSCYDSKTEVLTNNGWKMVSDIKMEDEVCTLNLNNNLIEFQKPLRLFKYNYKGKMYRLKTKRVDLFVTPNHKLLYSPCDFRKKPMFFLKGAEFLFNKSKRFKKDGIWVGNNPKYLTLPAVKIKHGSKYYSGLRNKRARRFLIKDWLKFFGFWIAEGWVTAGKKGDYGVYVANSNAELIEEMKRILISFGYKPYYYLNRGLDTIRVRDYQLFYYLKKFGKADKKFIPKEIKLLSKELLGIFFDYYIKGDGNIYGRNLKGLRATTISRLLRDDLQEIALKLGYSAYYKLCRKKGTPILSLPRANLKGYKQSEDSWNIYFIRKNIHAVMPSTIKKWNYIERWEDYNGFVYCLEVPNHVVYVRRNGIPVWCGNSDPAMNWRIGDLQDRSIVSFSDAHSMWPWRIGREATIFELEELSYNEIIKAIRTGRGIKATIETPPEYGKYHYDGHRLCNFSCSPEETKKLNEICPICKKKLTIGVEYRVDKIAEFPQGHKPKNAKPFYRLLPLHELLALHFDVKDVQNKKVWEVYNSLIKEFDNEFNILLKVKKEQFIAKGFDAKIIDLILKNRDEKIKVKPGFDGEYGKALMGERQVTL